MSHNLRVSLAKHPQNGSILMKAVGRGCEYVQGNGIPSTECKLADFADVVRRRIDDEVDSQHNGRRFVRTPAVKLRRISAEIW